MWSGIHTPEPGPLDTAVSRVLFLALTLAALTAFSYVVWRRLAPLLQAARDPRFDRPATRAAKLLRFGLLQWKQPRYAFAGALHISLFLSFLVLATRSVSLVLFGILGPLPFPASMSGAVWLYSVIADYAATVVLIVVALAAARRILVKPRRYEVPPNFGKSHATEALLILCLIATLMISESIFDASRACLAASGEPLAFTLASFWYGNFAGLSAPTLRWIEFSSYVVHDLTFFGFLCLLPFGKHFHVLTSLFNVFLAKLDRERLKPACWDATEDEAAVSQPFGVSTFTDFTWKQMLDFYSCADCGRCSDQCPSVAVGRALSPRFFTLKARDYAFRHYPLFQNFSNGGALVGTLYSEDEIWSCTTCGACEEECPLLVEYTDKIVDLRRGLVDRGCVPATLQKPLKAIESRGNPYGKLQKKRADWTKSLEGKYSVPVIEGGKAAATLYFVDSFTSYDDRMQSIARATARVLTQVGVAFSILGPAEQDSGHEVRRLGEETLFFSLRDQNTEAIKATRAERVITSDPHTFNALKHDYNGLPPVQHISEVMAQAARYGRLRFGAARESDVYTLHDACYLGRHNHLYDAPREVLDSIPELRRVEMKRCRDRSFCCGGGGLMLFYEAKEEERMGVVRVRMAAEAGANVIVTECPFCLANLEDAIKVSGLEGTMTAIDLTELADRQLARRTASTGA